MSDQVETLEYTIPSIEELIWKHIKDYSKEIFSYKIYGGGTVSRMCLNSERKLCTLFIEWMNSYQSRKFKQCERDYRSATKDRRFITITNAKSSDFMEIIISDKNQKINLHLEKKEFEGWFPRYLEKDCGCQLSRRSGSVEK